MEPFAPKSHVHCQKTAYGCLSCTFECCDMSIRYYWVFNLVRNGLCHISFCFIVSSVVLLSCAGRRPPIYLLQFLMRISKQLLTLPKLPAAKHTVMDTSHKVGVKSDAGSAWIINDPPRWLLLLFLPLWVKSPFRLRLMDCLCGFCHSTPRWQPRVEPRWPASENRGVFTIPKWLGYFFLSWCLGL